MSKITFIIGPRDSGKTTIANKIAAEYKNVIKMCMLHPDNHFQFNMCTIDTDLIIIDDLMDFNDNKQAFIRQMIGGVLVEKQCEKSFVIHPDLVVVINTHKQLFTFENNELFKHVLKTVIETKNTKTSMEDPAEYKTKEIMQQSEITQTINKLKADIDTLLWKLKTKRGALKLTQSLCKHTHADGTTAFKYIGSSHNYEVSQCSICSKLMEEK